MSLLWVICGAGRGVGKTHLAQRLCDLLPDAVYAKQGCGPRRADKAPNLLRTLDQVERFIAASAARYQHLVVESNALARKGRGDVIIFLDRPADGLNRRTDAHLLRSRAHVQLGPGGDPAHWSGLLREKLGGAPLRHAICDLFAEQHRHLMDRTPAVCQVAARRLNTINDDGETEATEVAVEELLTLLIADVGSFPLLCTPCDLPALAVGFAFSEGLIESADDVRQFTYRPDEQVATLQLDAPPARAARSLIVSSSCGLCGRLDARRLLEHSRSCADTLRLPATALRAAVERMSNRQRWFPRTGATHAAAIFDGHGELLALAEDIGRHNALDKVIGMCLLARRSPRGCGVALSGRVSLDLVAKAVRAGLELIAAVSAPTSAAIQLAAKHGLTLCAFVRGHRATVYTHEHRIVRGD